MSSTKSSPATVIDLPQFYDLLSVLVECTVIIACGYLSGRAKLITRSAKDISNYITYFALPAVIFSNIAQIDINAINWSFLLCIFASKFIMFAVVALISLFVSKPRDYGVAGALSIFCTQSNDFALGYPLVKSLYQNTTAMTDILSLLAPIQLLFLNPFGIAMLEWQKRRKHQQLSTTTDNNNDNYLDNNNRNNDNCRVPSTVDTARAQKLDYNSKQQRRQQPWTTPSSTINNFANVIGNVGQQQLEHQQQSIICPHEFNVRGHSDINPLPTYEPIDTTEAAATMPSVDTHLARFGGSCSTVNTNIDHSIIQRHEPPLIGSPARSWTYRSSSKTMARYVRSFSCARHTSRLTNNFFFTLLCNPLIAASIAAAILNYLNGPVLPIFVTKFVYALAASFAAPALFMIGLSMAGKFELFLQSSTDLLLAILLVLSKEIMMPLLMRTVVAQFYHGPSSPNFLNNNNSPSMISSEMIITDFGFLYGTFPTAPTAYIIAGHYNVLPNVISISMVLSTLLAAPLMLVSAAFIKAGAMVTPALVLQAITTTMIWCGGVGTVLALATLVTLTLGRRRYLDQQSIYPVLVTLVIAQLVVSLGGFMRIFVPDASNSSLSMSMRILMYVQYVIGSVGLTMTHFLTLCLIITMCVVQNQGTRYGRRAATLLLMFAAATTVILLVYFTLDGTQLQFESIESSAPNRSASLYVRLTIGLIIVCLSCLFMVILVHLRNRSILNFALLRRNSTPSASSLTLGTEVGTIAASIEDLRPTSKSSSPLHHQHGPDSNEFTSSQRTLIRSRHNKHGQSPVHGICNQAFDVTNEPSYHVTSSPVSSSYLAELDCHSQSPVLISSNHHHIMINSGASADDLADADDSDDRTLHCFIKHSSLIVFMIMVMTIHLSLVAQKLSSTTQFGTYRLLEIMSVALQFGQSLVTFIIYALNTSVLRHVFRSHSQ